MHVKILYRPDVLVGPHSVSATPEDEYANEPVPANEIAGDLVQDLPELLVNVHLTGPKDKTPPLTVTAEAFQLEALATHPHMAYDVTTEDGEVDEAVLITLPAKVYRVILGWYQERRLVTPGDYTYLFNGSGVQYINKQITLI